MKPSLPILVGLLVGATWPSVAEEQVRYRFWKEIDRGASQAEDILALRLDSDIYAATRDGLPDLRIFDDAGVEAPFQIEPEVEHREERLRYTLPTEVLGLEKKGNSIEIRLRLPEKSPAAEGFCIVTPLVNYERKVRVAGSEDGVNWTPLVSDGVIFDYSRYMDVRNSDVALPANAFRQFRITIDEVTDERESPYKELTRTLRSGKEDQRVERTAIERRALRIDRILMVYHVAQQHVRRVKKVEYPVKPFQAEQDAQNKQTLLYVQTCREPLTSFTLQTSSRNFFRRAAVQVPVVVSDGAGLRPDRTEWRDVGSANISRLQFRSFRREQLTVSFPEQRQEKYRIVVFNEDNPPLEIQAVQAEGNVYRAVFLAQEGKSYRVFYGSETAEAPKYEAGLVLASLRKDFQPVEVRLGHQIDNAAFADEPGLSLRNVLNSWIFLGAAIVLMVAVLAWGLVRAGRHLEQMPKE